MATSLRPGMLATAAAVLVACGANVSVINDDAGVSTGTTTGTSIEAFDACTTAADCGWGEIDHEILSSSDCVCLFGCPYIPLSQKTVERRQAQYQALCTPGKDGQGNPCPIDDCAGPPEAACQAGHCVAATTP